MRLSETTIPSNPSLTWTEPPGGCCKTAASLSAAGYVATALSFTLRAHRGTCQCPIPMRSRAIDRRPEVTHERPDAVEFFRGFLDHLHQRAAHDHAVGDRGHLAHLLGPADPESDADRGRRLLADPQDQLPHPLGQLV